MKKITFILVAFLTINLGFGQSIFDNPITTSDPENDNPYTIGQYFDPNIVVSGIGRGTGINPANGFGRYNANSWNTVALDNTAYFEFTIAPNFGYEIDFVSFEYTGQRSPTGANNFAFRSSLDGYSANIGTPVATGATIDLSSPTYQNITSSITFRLYGWGATGGGGTCSINDFIFNGVVNAIPCPGGTVTWNGTTWSATPDSTTEVIIDGNYNTSGGGSEISFNACSLTINAGATLTVDNGTFVEVENDVTVDGSLIVRTQGNFVQIDDAGTFTNNGLSRVNKQTATKAAWYYYTYWSSPVVGETIGSVFPDVDGDRRFLFNAANFVDNNGDDIDDNGDDWQPAYSGFTMDPGTGYAVTEARLFFGGSGTASFEGEFNTGDVDVNITYNVANTGFRWNFIGNPYPSAVDFDAFHAANSAVVDGVAYFWSQATPPDSSNPGNQDINFSNNDYATYTVGVGGAAGGGPDIPNQYIPSAQGFFIPAVTIGTATFTNAMRMADGTSNSQFFRGTSSNKKSNSLAENRLWVNLTSDNGVFNQILVGYVNGGTDGNDGLAYDAPRLISPDAPAVLYTSMVENNKKYVIQGKDINSINEDEVIQLGFSTTIDVATLYKLSIAQLEGNFLSSNSVYLKDNMLNTIHDLSVSDYTFTSEVGEFNNRFEIVFKQQALSTDFDLTNVNSLKIVELDNHDVQFTASNNLKIKAVNIYDLFGRQLYQLKGQNTSETYKLSNLKSTVYIAKVELSNGAIVTKKAVKK
ncbi:T9SS type A sorting domain-containing protein [Flavobacteriaceae bacterium SZ-1-7]|uniref:T9SS type A sorting domain-containing protein n=1 Tax=Tamlana sedimenti TaxID=3134126 RepID=UPI00312056F1